MKLKLAIGAAMAGAFSLGALIVAYSSARQDEAVQTEASRHISTSFSQLEEDEIRQIVRQYIMDNPDILIQSINEYGQRRKEREIAYAKEAAPNILPALLDPATSFVAGKNPDKAKVAVVELFDYHCSVCKRATPQIQQMLARDPAVKFIFRELPTLSEESDFAAQASLAAKEQGKFLDFHFAMMEASGMLKKERIFEIAKQQGLDTAKLGEDAESEPVIAAITQNHAMMAEMNLRGTPTFVIATLDGSFIDVMNGYHESILKDKIDAAKKAAKK